MINLAVSTKTEIQANKQDNKALAYAITELIFNMIPCYIFLVTASIRYYQLKKSNMTPSDNIPDYFPLSFQIKRRLSYFIFGLNILNALVLYSSVESNSYELKLQPFWWVYLIASGAWWFSASLLKVEFYLEEIQAWITHRSFWLLSFCVCFIKIFNLKEGEFMYYFINILKLFANLVLSAYAIWKPRDFETNYSNPDDEIPVVVRNMLNRFENDEYVKYIFKTKDIPKTKQLLLGKQSIYQQGFEKFDDYLKRNKSGSFAKVDQEKFLLDALPAIKLEISRRLLKKVTEKGEQYFYYVINTSIEDQDFKAERRYQEFLELEKQMQEIYTPEKYDKIYSKLPVLEKINLSQFGTEDKFIDKRFDVLEVYLNKIINEPGFINTKVLDFLEVNDYVRGPFLTYFSFLNTTRTRELATSLLKDKKPVHIAFDQIELQNFERKKIGRDAYYQGPTFDCQANDWMKTLGEHYEFIFVMTATVYQGTKQQWRLGKTFSMFKKFHENLENSLNRRIPLFEKYVPKLPGNAINTTDPRLLQLRLEGLEKYLKAILVDAQYQNNVLYEFIEYDPKNNKPLLDIHEEQTPISIQVENDIKQKIQQENININSNKGQKNKVKFNEVTNEAIRNVVQKYTNNNYIEFSNCIITVLESKYVQNQQSGITTYLYQIQLNEPNPKDKTKIYRRILLQKTYEDFEILSNQLNEYYPNLNNMPQLPNIKQKKLIDLGKIIPFKGNPSAKEELEIYINLILRLPNSSNNEILRKFFMIDFLKVQFMKNINGVEVYDLVKMNENELFIEIPEENNKIVSSVKGVVGVVTKVGNIPGKVAGGIINKLNNNHNNIV